MSVNKLWTLIYISQEDRVSTFGLVSVLTQILVGDEFSKTYINNNAGAYSTLINYLNHKFGVYPTQILNTTSITHVLFK